MRLKKLELTNFRCFESLSIDLDEQLTVLVAKNGQGKTSVLDAIRIGLWPFVSGFDLARNPASDTANNISIDDVRMIKVDEEMKRQLPSKIVLHGDYKFELTPGPEFPEGSFAKLLDDIGSDKPFLVKTEKWARGRKSEAKGTKTYDSPGAKQLKELANSMQIEVRNPERSNIDLFIIGYYGTGRLWGQKRLTEDQKAKSRKQDMDFYMRLFGYRDCLDPSSSYKHFADWFTWVFECYREDQIKQAEKSQLSDTDSVWLNTIKVVQQAIDAVLQDTGWHSLEYSVTHEKSLILKHDEQGILKVELLSDGIRGVLAMVGDITYRCIKLNPHLGLNAAKESQGIIMIDEVDMHLHPAWQQTILGNLTKAFPKIQFIVTTHSPQVLTTVKPECIRILSENGEVLTPAINTYGEESKVILEDVMQVSSRPHTQGADLLGDYLKHINQGDIDSPDVIRWRQELEQVFGSDYSQLKLADMVINKWRAKRGIA